MDTKVSKEQIQDALEAFSNGNLRDTARRLFDTLSYRSEKRIDEVALDPELLGHVFENLLAAYNPETDKTARKTTGSFYTPRVVVDFMVDEALIAYLESRLQSAIPKPESAFEPRLRQLLRYTDEPHQFSTEEVQVLVDAIDQVKILDPACGSLQ